jgi:hypothetical protein
MQITTIFNEGNTTLAVNQLPVTIMQPMDHILNLLCIHYIDHKRVQSSDHVDIYFDADLEPNVKQILAVLKQFQFKLWYFNYQPKFKKLSIIVSQSKAILN